MTDMPIQSELMYKIVMNTFLVSIPEEIFFILFTYIMMGEFDRWKDEDCKRLFEPWDYSRIFAPVIASALISNILRYSGADLAIILPCSFLTLFIGMVVMADIFNNARAVKWIGSAFVFLLLGTLYAGLCEFLYIPVLIYGTGKTLAEINNSMLQNFVISIPAKIMEYSLLAFMVAHKRALLKTNIIKVVLASRALTAFTLVNLISNLCFLIVMYRMVCYERVLEGLSADVRLIVIIGICLLPLINLSTLIGSIYYLKNCEAAGKKATVEQIKNLRTKVKATGDARSIHTILWKLNGLYTNLDDIARGLDSAGNIKKGGERHEKI